jgi:hypothetical protein
MGTPKLGVGAEYCCLEVDDESSELPLGPDPSAPRALVPLVPDQRPPACQRLSTHAPIPPTRVQSFRWPPVLDTLDGIATRNYLACPTLAPRCLFFLAHRLHYTHRHTTYLCRPAER